MKKTLNLLVLIMISALVACTTKPKAADESRQPASQSFPGYAWLVRYDKTYVTDSETGAKLSAGDKLVRRTKEINDHVLARRPGIEILNSYDGLYRICEAKFDTRVEAGNVVELKACHLSQSSSGEFHADEIAYDFGVPIAFPTKQQAINFKRNLENNRYVTIGVPYASLDTEHKASDVLLSPAKK